MKKSKKFILSLIVIIVAAIVIILANPDWFDNGSDDIITEPEVTETQQELGDEIFD